jgi:hypothetical protein
VSWLSRLTRPKPHSSHQRTTIVFHRNDSTDPIIHNLQGLWVDEALYGVLEALVQEYYDDDFDHTCEILWQDGEDTWGEDIDLVLHVRRL